MHPIIKVMLVGGKADGLLVSVADDATEVSVTPAQYGAPSGQPLSYRIVSQTIDDERYYFGVFSEAHQDSDKLTRVALTRGMKKCSVKPCPNEGVRGYPWRRSATVAAFISRAGPMMIQYIRIQNFRSVRDIALELGPLNIVFGPNGCGKSNIYNAIHLLTAAADGRLSGFISEEGGLENMMWSGERSPVDRHPRRLQIACRTDSFDYELQIGFPEKLPYPTQFMLDPIVKEENIWLAGYSRRPSSRVLQRKNQAAFLVDVTGEKSTFTESIYENESVFGQLGEPHRFPEVSRVRETLRRWRFYHEFAIGRHSPLRQPAVGYRSPVLDSDGHNLAPAFQTIVEIGAEEILHEILADAFPGCQFYCENEQSRFALKMRREGIRRPLLAAEMSDGTLRFLCLAVALLSPRPPAFLAINEPENSLHRDMLPALARLIIEASRYSQIWLTSHSAELAELIAAGAPCQRYALENRGGETRIAE